MFGKQRIRVGILGLGIIGSRIAAHLREAGFPVAVWNRTPKTEPNFLGSPAEVAQASDVIQLFVADPKAVFEVLEAMGDSLTSRHIVVCSSTIGREATLKAAEIVQAKGARFLDTPFTGTKGAADKGQLVYFIGGDDATFEAVKPILEPVSKAIVRIGDIGQAALVKVLTNVISAATIEVLAETLAIVKAEGMDPELMVKALEYHGARSGMTDLKFPKLLQGDFEDTHFSLKHMLKDVHFGLENATELKLDVPVTQATATAMEEGMEKGWADLDFSVVMKRYNP
jgi:3-hydroxyisobutyrate dehydrogenase-like beta-hydroxyacid dehydrogenase